MEILITTLCWKDQMRFFDVSVVDFIEIIKYNVGDDVKLEYAKGDKANTVLSFEIACA